MIEKRLSCGVVLARETEAGWMTLLLRAYHHWDFPKGIREEGEQSLDAALREVREETGISDLQFNAWAGTVVSKRIGQLRSVSAKSKVEIHAWFVNGTAQPPEFGPLLDVRRVVFFFDFR